jgi:hypothetical protein
MPVPVIGLEFCMVITKFVFSLHSNCEKTKVGLCDLHAVCDPPLSSTFEWVNQAL